MVPFRERKQLCQTGTRKPSGLAGKVLDFGGGYKDARLQYSPSYTFVLCGLKTK